MNQAHLHLLFNHLPILVPMVGLAILIVGMVKKSAVLQNTGMMVILVGAFATLPAAATGEGAEEAVEKYQGITHSSIHEHEEKAEVFIILNYLLGAIAIVGIWALIKGKTFAKYVQLLILALGLASNYFAYKTGSSGGEIRHPEIKSGATNTEMPADKKGGEAQEEKEND